MTSSLITKYNVAAPRYTSYPTVPYWEKAPDKEEWKRLVKDSFDASNNADGISLYIHLPYCESLCTYCACNTRITVNHAVEEPYIQSLLKEWSMYRSVFGKRPVIREIHFGGGTPTFFSATNLSKLINGILEESDVHPKAEFSFEAHPANTTKEHLEALNRLGFRRVSFGIQDFDERVQDIINRKQTYEHVKKSVEEARAARYGSINFDLIYGLPLQTLQGITNTIQQAIDLRPDRIAFYNYAHVPWIKPGQRKFTEADLPSGVEKQELYERGRRLFLEAGYEEIGMDHFSLKTDSLYEASQEGRLHRNFMGYTHNYTQLMIGLGVSSISDTWNGFMQNVKTVEQYRELIAKNEFPIFKGHILNDEDLVLRRHILNIMCRFETSWEKEEEQCTEIGEAIQRLKEMVKDGLVELQPFQLRITPKGRAFLRNICMAFDDRLWRKIPGSQIFSQAM